MIAIATVIVVLTGAVVFFGLIALFGYLIYTAIYEPDPVNIGLVLLMVLFVAYGWASFYLQTNGG